MDLRAHPHFHVLVNWLCQNTDENALTALIHKAELTCREIESDPGVDPERRDYKTPEERGYFQTRWHLLNTLREFVEVAKETE